ncbi:MAG: DUF1800 domain-containing protein [Pyrinomonadaceae bacterium]|nr:DUF1800 domain-containing protein [Pyrinomonadaceae bacterium]
MKFIHKITAFILLLAISSPILAFGPDYTSKGKKLTEEQKILHVLNRLGFGARPNDIEKVKKIGIKNYIEQQLNANSIDDSVAENKVKNLEVMNLSTAELFAKYPNPGGILRMLEQESRVKQGTVAKNKADDEKDKMNADGKSDSAMMNSEESKADQAERRERRQKIAEIYQKYGFKQSNLIPQQIVANRLLRAVYSEKQLQEVMVDFWQNHFNVFVGKNVVRWYIPSYERDVIRKNALGNFKDLVVGTSQHPAMLAYLDNFENVAPNAGMNNSQQAQNRQPDLNNPKVRERIKQQYGLSDKELDDRIKQRQANPQQQRQRRGLNENYARELMELHTLGVDGGYTQADIIEVAKVFTGWTIADPRGYRRLAKATVNGNEEQYINRLQRQAGIPDDIESGEFYFNKNWHDKSEKTVLGNKIKPDGMNEGLKVIDILVNHPSTAKFIAKKLAVKFVSDNPSEAFVNRIAKAFTNSKGDIKTTLKAIFMDDEFFASENYRAKIKTPFELAVSSIRTLGADTTASPALLALLQKMGETPYGYQAPTGYGDTSEDWVNTGALLERLNYAIALSSNQIPQTKVDLKKFEAKDKTKILDNAIATILDNDVSSNTKQSLLKQIEQPLPEAKEGNDSNDELTFDNMRGGGQGARANRQTRLLPPSGNPEIYKVISLVLGTPEFQRQ